MYKIGVIRGDGIGPEVVEQGIICLNKVSKKFGFTFETKELIMGGIAYDTVGKPLPRETIEECLKSDAVLLGAVGGTKWDNLPSELRPEAALLGIRSAMGLYANIRPAKLFSSLASACPLKNEVVGNGGIDLIVIRELIGGIYFGKRENCIVNQIREAYDTEKYNEQEIRRIAKIAFETAKTRNKKVTSIDKANILESSRLWRTVVHEVAKEYSDIELVDMLVDNAAMQLIRNPSQFDVILASNMFGDILSDEAAMITGSIGILPSASLGSGGPGLYEPIHGSAPEIAGKNIANPIATILSVAMLCRYSLHEEKAAQAIEDAVQKVLQKGYTTADLCKENAVTTAKMGELIADEI